MICFLELDFQQTIGVDQDVWYYSTSHDDPCSEEKMITFYTWDFAGQVRMLTNVKTSQYVQHALQNT